MKMIHEIGLEVRSTAVCTAVRRVRYGHFCLPHALLAKHCDARSIAENIDFCRPLVDKLRLARQSDVISDRKVNAPAPEAYRNFVESEDTVCSSSLADELFESVNH